MARLERNPIDLNTLVAASTVLIRCASDRGTGFFVAPNLILTCAHVIRNAEQNKKVTVNFSGKDWDGLIVCSFPPNCGKTENVFPDIALIRVDDVPQHPCVLLDPEFKLRDHLSSFGYSSFGVGGETLSTECEGSISYEADTPDQTLIKFKDTQVRPGLSGSPLLNDRTGKVCGMVKRTRDERSQLGGYAVRVGRVFEVLPDLEQANRAFHSTDRTWSSLVGQPKLDLSAYRNALENDFGQLNVPTAVPLRQIYVVQRLREEADNQTRDNLAMSRPPQAASAKAPGGASGSRALDELLSESSRQLLVIVGGPGQGKSTMLAHHILQWIDGNARDTPLIIRLKQYANVRETQNPLLKYLEGGPYSLPLSTTEPLLEEGKATLLLDALDEILNPGLRAVVVEDIVAAARHYPAAHIILTTRSAGYLDTENSAILRAAGFRTFTLEGLDPQQSADFIQKWDALQGPGRKQSVDPLVRALNESASFQRLAQVPMHLALAIRNKKLANRAELYEQYAEHLLRARDVERNIANSSDSVADLKMNFLESIALEICEDEDGLNGTTISSKRFKTLLIQTFKQADIPYDIDAADQIQNGLTRRDSILEKFGAEIGFTHQAVLEYFAARAYCVRDGDRASPELIGLFRAHGNDFRWWEILGLICGILRKRAVPLIEELLSRIGIDHADYQRCFVAADCLAEMELGAESAPEFTAIRRSIKSALCELLSFDFPYVYYWDEPDANQVMTVRSGAAQRLYRWPDDPTRKFLTEAVTNANDQPSAAAYVSVIASTWPDAETFEWLHERMKVDGFPQIRVAALREVARRWPGAETRGWLFTILDTNEDPQLRCAACAELYWSDPNRTLRLQQALLRRLEYDLDEYVREEAARALTWCLKDDPDHVASILVKLAENDKHENVRRFALCWLATLARENEKTKTLCCELTAHGDRATLRIAALMLLRNWPDKQTRAVIETCAANDADSYVRGSAAELLAELWPDQQTRDILQQRLPLASDAQERSALTHALLRYATTAALDSRIDSGKLGDDYPEARIATIAELINRNPSQETWALLRKRAEEDSAPQVRAQCLTLVARNVLGEELDNWLIDRANRDADPSVEEAAVRELGRRTAAEPVRHWLLGFIQDHSSSSAVNTAICTLGRRWHDERTKAWLLDRIHKATHLLGGKGEGLWRNIGRTDEYNIAPGQIELQELVRIWRTDDVHALLLEILGKPREALAQWAVKALAWSWPGDRTTAILRELLLHEQPSCAQTAAAEAIAWRSHDESIRSMLADIATTHRHGFVRAGAIKGLAYQWREPRTRRLLEMVAEADSNSEVRHQAMHRLGMLWKDADLRAFFERRLDAEKTMAGSNGPLTNAASRAYLLNLLGKWR